MLLKPTVRRDQLLARWRFAAAAGGWPHPEIWWVPALEAVIDAVNGEGGDPEAAAQRLGRERAIGSVGLADALTDLRIGGDVLRINRRVHAQLAGALSTGWADAASNWLGRFGFGCVDPLTELATREYLRSRLRELYSERRPANRHVREDRVMVATSVRPSSDALVTERRMVVVGQVLGAVFNQGETVARIGPTVAVALGFRDECLSERMVGLQLELTWAGFVESPVTARSWLEPLPADYGQVGALLDEMCV